MARHHRSPLNLGMGANELIVPPYATDLDPKKTNGEPPMAQTTDIVLNGAGYMVQPGTSQSPGYKRHQDGMAEGRTERLAITDFFGGQRRALQLERDKFYAGDSVGPALGGQGVRPWAFQSQSSFPAVTLVDKDKQIPYEIVRDKIYFAMGKTLVAGPATVAGGTYTFTVIHTFANDIVDMCIYNSKGLLITFGSAFDIQYYDIPGGTTTTLFAGEKGNVMAAYAGHAAWSDSRTTSRPTIIRLGTGTGFDDRAIDYDPIAITTVGAEMIVVTKQALYSYTGRVKEVAHPAGGGLTMHEWSGEFSPFFQQGVHNERDDFRMLLGFGGRTLAWIAGGVHELVPSGDRAGWRSTGLTGRRCFGGCVAAGYVIVSIESDSGDNEMWAYDGNGWWMIATQAITAAIWCNPFPLNGAHASRYSVGFFLHGTTNVGSFRLVDDSVAAKYAFPTTAEMVTPMIDAGERDKTKAWRKLGAVFATPELQGNVSSVDPVNIFFDYSIDAGATWINLYGDSRTGNTMPNNNFALEFPLSGITSRFLMLRIRWSSTLDWAPTLVGLWAEYEVLDNPARRRKWDFKIHAHDQTVDRDGVMLTRTGRQLIAELWDAWENDTTVTFRDIDYDAAPVQRTVRIVGITEAVAQPADSVDWGDSVIALRLVEV